jgi:hypothetical protein
MLTKPRLILALFACVSFSQAARASTLFIGSDTEDFADTLPDRLAKATVTGAIFNSQIIIPTNYHLNGLGDGAGFLYAGTPEANHINEIDYNGNIVGGFNAAVPSGSCCNEEMQLVGNVLYHAHYLDEIERLDPVTGAAVAPPLPQADVVGMANVAGVVWISKWNGRSVGTWDPTTNIYTAKFSTPTNAGGIAFDPNSNILWVGLQGGFVVPYTLTGTALNAGFQPFGSIPDTFDGLTFLGEGTQAAVPEPLSLLLLGTGLVAAGRRRWQNRRKNA